MRTGIDTYSVSIARAREVGASFIVAYSSRLTREIANEVAAADLDLVLVFESSGHSYQGGAVAGELEAHEAMVQAAEAGMVGGYPIVFAPYDPWTPAQNIDWNLSPLLPYFEGVASVLPLSRIWAYGDYATVRFLFDSKVISGALQGAAASEGQWDARAQIRQTVYTPNYDLDEAMVDFFGQWRPGVPLHEKPPTPPLAFLTTEERAAYNRYEKYIKHPIIYARAISQVKAQLAALRSDIYRAAVHGVLPNGFPTELGWAVHNRLKRYHFIEKIVPPVKS